MSSEEQAWDTVRSEARAVLAEEALDTALRANRRSWPSPRDPFACVHLGESDVVRRAAADVQLDVRNALGDVDGTRAAYQGLDWIHTTLVVFRAPGSLERSLAHLSRGNVVGEAPVYRVGRPYLTKDAVVVLRLLPVNASASELRACLADHLGVPADRRRQIHHVTVARLFSATTGDLEALDETWRRRDEGGGTIRAESIRFLENVGAGDYRERGTAVPWPHP